MKTKPRDVLYCGVDAEKIKKAHPILNTKYLCWLHDYIVDRYLIHLKKDVWKYPKPWTNDPILQQYKFTNVRREHDTQTKYIINNICLNNQLSLEEKILNIFVARIYNNWDTVKLFGGPWSKDALYSPELKKFVKQTHPYDENYKYFGNAYTAMHFKNYIACEICNDKSTFEPIIAYRPFHIPLWIKKQGIIEKMLSAKDQMACIKAIQEMKGFGSNFIPYQIFVDCTYIPEFPFSENEVVLSGPGCSLGLSFLVMDPDGLTDEEMLFYLRDNIENFFKILETEYDYPPVNFEYNPEKLYCDLPEEDRHINIMSLENCFCEFGKYVKLRNNVSCRRRKYNGI